MGDREGLRRVLSAPAQTAAFGAALARACSDGARIGLCGELGTGKTTLVRGFLRALGYAGPVRSPTYTLLEPYALDHREVFHLDLYRLADPEELEFLGVRDLDRPKAVWLVEWPERGGGVLPPLDLTLRLDYHPSGRCLEATGWSDVGRDLLAGLGRQGV